MPATVIVVQHCADDPPQRLGDALLEAGCELRVVRADLGEQVPDSTCDAAGLLVLGGPMGAYDDETVPWLPATRALLARAVQTGLPTLAVCLGHQLLAVACGGRVVTGPAQQMGVIPVGATAAAATDPLFASLPPGAPATHWNNDLVVEPPTGAVVLATTDVPGGTTAVQAYRVGSRAWGVQFHPEVDTARVTEWAADDVLTRRQVPEVVQARLAGMVAVQDEAARVWDGFGRRFGALVQESAVQEVAGQEVAGQESARPR